MSQITKRFWLETFDCFSVSGKDAEKFLNGITTGNIINEFNHVCKTCWLSPNGVLKAIIEINFLEEKLEVIILEGNTHELIDYFNKIIFPADDVILSDPFSIYRFQEVDEINSWRIYPPIFFKNKDQSYKDYKKNLNIMDANDLKLWKINQAIPSMDYEIDGKNNPLELGLKDLIDFNKGCFLGQEKIAKIKNASSLKHEIRVWKSSDSDINLESNNSYLYDNFSKKSIAGKTTSFYKSDSEFKGLAIVKRKYLQKGKILYSEIFGNIKIDQSVGSIFP